MEPHPARSKACISEKLREVGDDGKGDGEVPWGSDFGKIGKQGRETQHEVFEVGRGDSWLPDIISDWKDGSEQILDTMVMHL